MKAGFLLSIAHRRGLLKATSLILLFILAVTASEAWQSPRQLPAYAADLAISYTEGSTRPSALCLPGVYLEEPDDCLPLGPSAHRTQLATQGIQLPLRPLAAVAADPSLVAIPYLYAKLIPGIAVPIYASLEDAQANASPVSYIAPGELRYISYIDEAYTSGGQKPDFFMLRDGGWVAAHDVEQRTRGTNRFQGLVFRRTPEQSFGWVLPLTSSLRVKKTP